MLTKDNSSPLWSLLKSWLTPFHLSPYTLLWVLSAAEDDDGVMAQKAFVLVKLCHFFLTGTPASTNADVLCSVTDVSIPARFCRSFSLPFNL